MSRTASTPQAIEAKRQHIFLAMRALLARKDFHSIKMEDVAKRAGIAKGSLYLYFKDKDSLYRGLVQSLFNKLSPQVATIVGSDEEPRKTLREILEIQVSFFEEHMDVFAHFFKEGPGSQSRDDSIRQCFRDYISYLTEVIKRGVSRSQFRRIDPVKAALILIGMVRSAIVERIHGFTKKRLTADVDAIWDIYMNGIGK